MAARANEVLTTFVWEGRNRAGTTVAGESQAISETLMKADLRKQGIVPLKIRKKPQSLFQRRKIRGKDIALFSRQLATMINAGVPMVQSMDIIGRGNENPAMQRLLQLLRIDVESGTNLAEALRKHPVQFDPLFCNLVSAGEMSGTLDRLLLKISIYKERTEVIKGKIKKALFYPAAVIVVAFLVTSILLLFVVPQFEELFVGFGADLPFFTKLVVRLSDFFQRYWWLIFGAMVGMFYGFFILRRRSPSFHRNVDAFALKIPALGDILRKSAIARFARTLSTMFAAGVPLIEAMDSVAGATGNDLYQEATYKIREDVATGTQLYQSMRTTGLFPNMVIQMTAIGEESGSLDDMLAKVAEFYEQEVDNKVDALSSILEPIIMVVLGVIVGALVIAMYLPIFKLGSVF
jgi:type IV pilus assembly protein PilC